MRRKQTIGNVKVLSCDFSYLFEKFCRQMGKEEEEGEGWKFLLAAVLRTRKKYIKDN
jgi:hypothetical protein